MSQCWPSSRLSEENHFGMSQRFIFYFGLLATYLHGGFHYQSMQHVIIIGGWIFQPDVGFFLPIWCIFAIKMTKAIDMDNKTDLDLIEKLF